MRFKGAMRLLNERDAVSEEENPLNAVGPHQLVDESNDCAGLAATSCHDQQGFVLHVFFECFAYATDRPLLIISARNLGVQIDFGHAYRGGR